ncbi:phospholipase A2 inhibitor and Ly6/PLAUR domain-containing protein-like [Ranitomeya imitator]|uniref:phospholipase A2 inhibitor and Ly6/PLAUR domain-containing protein-like n=1 Tax=Ranitomeya imitator TaxID=111125 RepID=UPI0037E7C49C
MTQFAPVLTILFVFIVKGNSLKCRECTTTSKGFCRGKLLECPSRSKSCIKALGLTVIGDDVYKSFLRGCNDDDHLCNRDFVMNSGHGNKQTRIITECCTSDDCNRCKAKIPPYNSTLNGFICPVCYSYNSYDCMHKGYIECRGNELECIDFAATLHKEGYPDFKFALMGCITQGGCSLGPKIIPGTKIVDVERLSCKSARPITH